MQQKFWFHAFHWQLMSTVGSTASSDVQSLNSLQLVEQKKLLMFKALLVQSLGLFFFVVLVFLCGFLTWWWWQNRHAYNPRQPMLYLIKSTMYLLSSFLRYTSIFVIKSTEVKDQLFDLGQTTNCLQVSGTSNICFSAQVVFPMSDCYFYNKDRKE